MSVTETAPSQPGSHTGEDSVPVPGQTNRISQQSRQAEPIHSAHLETAVLLQWTGKGGYCSGDTPKPEVVVLVATLTSPGVSCLNLMHEVTTKHLKQGGKVLGGMPSSESTP